MHTRESGFTLVELMIVVAVLGILASIALPSYQAYVFKARAVQVVEVLDKLHTVLAQHQSEVGTLGSANCIVFVGERNAPLDGPGLRYFTSASAASNPANGKPVSGIRLRELVLPDLHIEVRASSCRNSVAQRPGRYLVDVQFRQGVSAQERLRNKPILQATFEIMRERAARATYSPSFSLAQFEFQI